MSLLIKQKSAPVRFSRLKSGDYVADLSPPKTPGYWQFWDLLGKGS